MEAPIRTYGWPSLRVDDWSAHPRHLAHVDADRRQGPIDAHAADQPLVAGDVVRQPSRIDHGRDPTRHRGIRHGVRLRRPTSWRSVTATEASVRCHSSSKPVAEFYGETLSALDSLGIASRIVAHPNEVDPAIPFAEDYEHADYDADAAHLFWQQLVQAHRVILNFRASFRRQGQPSALLLGRFGLGLHAILRTARAPASRRSAQLPRLGNGRGLLARAEQLRLLARRRRRGRVLLVRLSRTATVSPSTAWNRMPRSTATSTSSSCCPTRRCAPPPIPTRRCSDFLQSTYEAAADTGGWDRDALEVDPHRLPPNDVSGAEPAGDE